MRTAEEATVTTVACPLERRAVDIERCARCYWKTDGHLTCASDDRVAALDWHLLLRLLQP